MCECCLCGGHTSFGSTAAHRVLLSRRLNISNSENQIAKQLNTTGNIYEADIEEIKKNQEEIYEGIKKILLSLSHLKCR